MSLRLRVPKNADAQAVYVPVLPFEDDTFSLALQPGLGLENQPTTVIDGALSQMMRLLLRIARADATPDVRLRLYAASDRLNEENIIVVRGDPPANLDREDMALICDMNLGDTHAIEVAFGHVRDVAFERMKKGGGLDGAP